MNTNISWLEFGKSILYTNTSSNYCKEFRIGDTITFQGRPNSSSLVIITEFTGDDPNGPIGMCYLPWRSEEHRWASVQNTLKGNPRHIICYPLGLLHCGQHIDWDTVCHVIASTHPAYIKKVKELTNSLECK